VEKPAPVQVNINTATVVELAYLPGIGPKTAERIVHYRKKQPFAQKYHLKRVRGIGYKMLQKLKPYIVVKGHTTATGKIVIPKE
jgi:competence protein ComEA